MEQSYLHHRWYFKSPFRHSLMEIAKAREEKLRRRRDNLKRVGLALGGGLLVLAIEKMMAMVAGFFTASSCPGTGDGGN